MLANLLWQYAVEEVIYLGVDSEVPAVWALRQKGHKAVTKRRKRAFLSTSGKSLLT